MNILALRVEKYLNVLYQVEGRDVVSSQVSLYLNFRKVVQAFVGVVSFIVFIFILSLMERFRFFQLKLALRVFNLIAIGDSFTLFRKSGRYLVRLLSFDKRLLALVV